VPVVASGGAGTPSDFLKALIDGKADAVLAASIFHYRTYSIRDVKKFLGDKGIPVRLER
jgi:cyclase